MNHAMRGLAFDIFDRGGLHRLVQLAPASAAAWLCAADRELPQDAIEDARPLERIDRPCLAVVDARRDDADPGELDARALEPRFDEGLKRTGEVRGDDLECAAHRFG